MTNLQSPMTNLTHTFVETNGTRLHVVQAGPVGGPLVILLHGFPEFWYGWRHQIDALVDAGFWVWAPDQRGYNLSDKPMGINAYTIDTLVADIVGLIDAAGRQKALIVGHDWGAAVAWWLAGTHPDRVERLVVLNVPHPAVMNQFARRDLGQLRRSWYIGFFQLPRLPEFLCRLKNWAALIRILRWSSQPGTFTEADFDEYRAAWSQPGAFTAMVNWYRAALQKPPKGKLLKRITIPTLLIWGACDQFLRREMAQPSIDRCDNGRVVFFEQATHWVQHEESEQVNRLIIDFVNKNSENFFKGEPEVPPAIVRLIGSK